jgi:lysophospholipase L1-like esterase
VLERNAAAGPVGARRTAALAVLRPFLAMSERLGLVTATGSVERALGHDPDAQPGGELVLPDVELPPEAFEPIPGGHEPSGDPSPNPGPGGGESGEDEGHEDGGGAEPVTPTGLRQPTSSNKLRVAVIGDSLSQGLGPAIEQWMSPDVVRVLSLGRQSTGLSRQDYFNWQAGMREIVEEFRPDLVFILLGSNDAQPQISPDGTAIPVGNVSWIQGYRDQAAHLLSEATSTGARVVWVGIPIVEQRSRWDFYRRVNEIYRDMADRDPLGTYLDTWSLFRANDGGYRAFVRNERGVLQEMRAPDGIHFTPTGYAYLGRMALRAAAASFGLPQSAVAFRL